VRRERDLNRAVDSGSLVDFLNLAVRQALIAASLAEGIAGGHFDQAGGRGAGSAVEGWRAELLGELSQKL
jgi:hypothetical protein